MGFDALFPGKGSRCLFATPALADEWHERAKSWQSFLAPRRQPLITTEYVLVEMGDGLANLRFRKQAIDTIDALRSSALVEIIPASSDLLGEAVDLYHFTSLLNRTLDDAGRRRMIEMMWEIAFADRRISEFEDNLIWRAADLLFVPSRERIELRRAVAARSAAPDAEAGD